jgi:hypothetical protein
MNAADAVSRTVGEWLETLDRDQRSRAVFPFDTGERLVWAYTPGERAGLALADMRPAQRTAAMRIVAAAMSERGAREVTDIIALETILGALEQEGGRGGWLRRDPEKYWFAVFGDAAGDEGWSWRIGGHHIAIQLTLVGRRVVGSTPSFLGANPAVVPRGPRSGVRALTGEETLARELLLSLPPDVRPIAVVDPVAPPDIMSGNGARADLRSIPSGIRYDALGRAGQDGLERLIRHYVGRVAEDIAAAEWARIEDAGLGATTFAWAGPAESGRGHYYAIRGPEFLIEYDNTQNDANHIHAVWRDVTNDWGADALAAHYGSHHASGS